MKIDVSRTFKNLDGKDIEPAVTLAKVATDALLAHIPDEKTDGEEKAKRWQLAMRIHEAGSAEVPVIDLKSEDVAKIKKLIGLSFQTLVVGQAYDMLENCQA